MGIENRSTFEHILKELRTHGIFVFKILRLVSLGSGLSKKMSSKDHRQFSDPSRKSFTRLGEDFFEFLEEHLKTCYYGQHVYATVDIEWYFLNGQIKQRDKHI